MGANPPKVLAKMFNELNEAAPILLRHPSPAEDGPACTICHELGHQSTACPCPNVRACPTCGTRDPADGHVCKPCCSLCKGEHLTASKGCPQRFCEPIPGSGGPTAACTTTWPPSTETREHPGPPGLLLFIAKELSIAVPVPVKIPQPFFKGRQHPYRQEASAC
ncbi:hypothetical protein HPB48_020542 [Haemaphysalis longicornis]|uniref:Uncharacterized protein n=1 Tax=Haemaphysalis longicornis TaxID=44386 RepID=A0A9J6G4R2_HAELO|nr:hypothetical protein HPB48_020542 [Haemaphysalis longicornis]